jgi:sugar phosphate isomerase/epimerase
MWGTTMTDLCLWSGTLSGHDIWTRIRAAGRAGFTSLSVAPCELLDVLATGDEDRLEKELATHAVHIGCLDPVPTWLPNPVPAHPAHRVHATVPASRCLDLAERFGIGLVNAIDVTWRPLPAAAGSLLAEFAEQAVRRGVRVLVEAQIYSAIPNLATALGLCREAGPNVLPMVDSWHFSRDHGSRLDDLREHRIGALQLSDGPRLNGGADLVTESTTARLMPGQGGFDLVDLVAAMPADCLADCLVGPEVFSPGVPSDRVDDVAGTAFATTRGVLLEAAGRVMAWGLNSAS